MNLRLATALALVTLLAACGNSPAPEGTAPPAPATQKTAAKPTKSAAATAESAPKAAPGELVWDAPASFKKVENPSKMRRATYEAPKVGSDAEAPTLSVIVAGGSVDANIDRWIGQFDETAKATVKRDTKKVGTYDVTIVEMKGTFSGGGMPGAPAEAKKDQALLGAVVPVGDQAWFFKMTGPQESVAAARADFDALIGSLHAAP